MITNNPAILAQIIGFGIFLWVGLYVLVRGARRTPLIIVSLIGLFAQAIFFGIGALTDTQTDPRWFMRWSAGACGRSSCRQRHGSTSAVWWRRAREARASTRQGRSFRHWSLQPIPPGRC
ncbi:MAG: hypothetical protein M3R61_02920 [Chloroflexota bacterium]|nr:hypothetical protein [Chloroflexota bacterium]